MAMNDKITIQEVTEARSTTGAVTESWTTHVTCWADIEQASGNEQFVSDMTVYNDIKRFKVGYQEVKDVTPKMRISYNSGYYYITSVDHAQGKINSTLIAVRQDDE
jgi:SPP1 family predicted phage head-tail adaptor